MTGSLKDLLVFGRTVADPFHRVHYCDRSVLLLVEFCQAEGPKPICHYPVDVGPYLNLDNVAIWLMSSENFHGSRLMLYNQQMDLYALVYHVTLLDVAARGFQRPIALAFLCSEKPSLTQRSAFKRLSIDLFRPFLACNRRLFCSYAEHVVELANEIQRHKFHTYYSLVQSEVNFGTISMKVKQIAKQAGILVRHHQREESSENAEHPQADEHEDDKQHFNLQFMDIYRMISVQPSFCECGKDLKEFERFVKVMERPVSTELVPIFELAPCIAHSFHQGFEHFYDEMSREDRPKGVLFAAGFPVWKSASGANTHLLENSGENDESQENTLDTDRICREFPNENSLSSFSTALTNSLYSLLSGQKIAILASDQRRATGVDLLTKLNDLRVCKRKEAAVWRQSSENADTQTQLIGLTCARDQSHKLSVPGRSVCIDLNNNRLLSQIYNGRLLRQLAPAIKFPSDQSLLLYLVSLISDICLIARVARRKPLELVAKALKLNAQDLLILANILAEYDLVKFMHKREEVAASLKRTPKRQRF